jgi:signal transduction histidine kinase
MTAVASTSAATAQRIEELGRIIMAYSEVTEKLEQSHTELTGRVQQLQAELSEKNRELERSNRLAALGEMAAGLAHEIRNPLGGIQLYASLLAQDVADRPESAKIVTKIIGGVKRVEALVSQVLRFTREIVASPESCDVVQVVRDTIETAQMQIASKSDANTHGKPVGLSSGSSTVSPDATSSSSTFPTQAHGAPVGFDCVLPESFFYDVDERLFSQALLNLVLNAHEAMIDIPAPTIRVVLAPHKGKLKLTVEDNGPGIPPESLDRIFNPFFTTKDEGTGLGLSIVHRIVEAHNGIIKATNRKGGGARFEITI